MTGRNRLGSEASPYLRQHADNPVDWWPWGDAAFAVARDRGVPVLLSVGYSACHWCHVMAHESFEDEPTAAVMNELFVNVKVDREERPDVDAIYMEAVQQLTGSGGWPMTVWLDHEGRPFHAGTYFPTPARGGMPSFADVCRAVDDAWRNRREKVDEAAGALTDAIRRTAEIGTPGAALPAAGAVDDAADALLAQVDHEWGGFGGAPKFPQTMSLELLLRVATRTGRADLLAPVTRSLDAMAAGGIYDHVGGGFARYSVDHRWLIPHFEKMLYDQALLLSIYTHAWQVTGEPAYRQVVDETVAYVLRDLRLPEGGLASAEDADSEGVEGRFYVWSLDELVEVAGEEAAGWYGATAAGNFEGANNLVRPLAGPLERPPAVEAARARLFDRRALRVRPGLDDKVLTEWNALLVTSLAQAGAATGEPAWVEAAESVAGFLLDHLRVDGRWHRSWQADAGARHLAYAADHAALVDACTRLYEATGHATWLAEAQAVADQLLDRFHDEVGGGFFTTAHDAEVLVARQKELVDGATPSANSAAAVALWRLAALTGERRYEDAAVEVVALLGDLSVRHPGAFANLLCALDLVAGGTTEVVVTGDRPDLVGAVQARYLPAAVLAWGERTDSPLWADRTDGLAYVCDHWACKQPVADVDALLAQLTHGS